MKNKLLLLFFSCSLIFVSCKKDKKDEAAPDTNAILKQKIIGKWNYVKTTTEQYDASGKLAKTEDQTPESIQTWEFVDGSTANSSDFRGVRKYSYSIDQTDGINNISLTYNSTTIYKLEIDNNRMIWTTEGKTGDPTYPKAKQINYLDRQ
jgi:hypothetical protein